MQVDEVVHRCPDTEWLADGPTHGVEALVEAGQVLSFERLRFALLGDEPRFLDPRWTDGQAKNISLRWPSGELRGAAGDGPDLAALRTLIERYADHAETLALRLFPYYRGHLRRGNTSLRPADIASRATTWRKDDTRLHVDAFPSNPTRGTRLLRVFCNINPAGRPRQWRLGEPFEAYARRYLSTLRRPVPGSARLLAALKVTKQRRTEYDHLMLQLHDRAKADDAFQRSGPQVHIDFAPGTTWVVFSDQVLHAAMSGQHMLEQTFLLDVEHLLHPESSPLRTLERLTGRRLGPRVH